MKQFKTNYSSLTALSFQTFALMMAFLCLPVTPARADCVSPVGLAGQQLYNTTYNIMQYCNGTDWVSMAGNGGASMSIDNLIDGISNGTSNVFLGTSAGNTSLTGTNDTAVGISSLTSLTTGANNTAFGYNTGNTTTSGSGNILIGNGMVAPTASTSNWLNIGGIITGDMSLTAGAGINGLAINGTGALRVPNGNATTDRPGTPALGMIRYNTISNSFEGYSGSTPGWNAVGGSITPLSALTAAVATHTLANANFAQVWNWDTLSTETALALGSTSMTSGSLLNIANTNATGTGPALLVSSSNPTGLALKSSGNALVTGLLNVNDRVTFASLAGAAPVGLGGNNAWLTFVNQGSAALNSTITSDTITVRVAGTATCGTGCTGISRNGGAFVAGPVSGFVVGDTIAIRQLSSTTGGVTTTALVTVGSVTSNTWNVTTTQVVNAFSFTDQVGVPISSTITSNTVTLAGGFTNLTATCNAGCTGISRNGAAFTAGPVSGFNSGDTIAIRLNSSASNGAAVTASVTVGPATSSTWTVTTICANVQVFTSAGTWNKPTGCTTTTIQCYGGGGGGGGASGGGSCPNGASGAGGGGSGGAASTTVATSSLAGTVSVSIGTGGGGGVEGACCGGATGQNGSGGGTTSFGGVLSIAGGGGGHGGVYGAGGAAGGAGGPGGVNGGAGGPNMVGCGSGCSGPGGAGGSLGLGGGYGNGGAGTGGFGGCWGGGVSTGGSGSSGECIVTTQ